MWLTFIFTLKIILARCLLSEGIPLINKIENNTGLIIEEEFAKPHELSELDINLDDDIDITTEVPTSDIVSQYPILRDATSVTITSDLKIGDKNLEEYKTEDKFVSTTEKYLQNYEKSSEPFYRSTENENDSSFITDKISHVTKVTESYGAHDIISDNLYDRNRNYESSTSTSDLNKDDDDEFDDGVTEQFTTTGQIFNDDDNNDDNDNDEDVDGNKSVGYYVNRDDSKSLENISETINVKEEIKPDLRKENLETISTLLQPFTPSPFTQVIDDEKNIRRESLADGENSSELIDHHEEEDKYSRDTFSTKTDTRSDSPIFYHTTEINDDLNYSGTSVNDVDLSSGSTTEQTYSTSELKFRSETENNKKILILKIGDTFSNVPQTVAGIFYNKIANNLKNYNEKLRKNSVLSNLRYVLDNSVNSSTSEDSLNYSIKSSAAREVAENFFQHRPPLVVYKKQMKKRGGQNTDFLKLYRWFYRIGQDQADTNYNGFNIEVRSAKCNNDRQM